MDSQFNQLRDRFSDGSRDYTPPWGLASEFDFVSLSEQYGCRFPPSYIRYHTYYARFVPPPDNALKWLTVDISEAYLALEATIQDARKWGVPDYFIPFWEDESNFFCFDTRKEDANGEFPIVFWEHDAPNEDQKPMYDNFVAWLAEMLERKQKRR